MSAEQQRAYVRAHLPVAPSALRGGASTISVWVCEGCSCMIADPVVHSGACAGPPITEHADGSAR